MLRSTATLLLVAVVLASCRSAQPMAPEPKVWTGRFGGDITWEFTEKYGCFFDDVLDRRSLLDSDESRGDKKYLPLEGDPLCDVIARTGRPYRIDHNVGSESWWYSVRDPSKMTKRTPGTEIDPNYQSLQNFDFQLEVVMQQDSAWSSPIWPQSHWRVVELFYHELRL